MVDLATFQISLEVRRSVIFDGLDRVGEDIGVVAKNEAIRSPTALLLFFELRVGLSVIVRDEIICGIQ